MIGRRSILIGLGVLLGVSTFAAAGASAQAQPSAAAPPSAPKTATPPPTPAAEKPPVKAEELEQLLAPLALYPDSLLAQVLMAATYPLEVVQADRWVKQNKDLKGDALTKALEKQDWDASVKSLVNFPTVLAMMSEKLDVTIKVGDAFIAQQTDVLNTVQKLRAKAQAQGNLKSNEQQKVTVAQAPPATGPSETIIVQQAPPQIITIEPTNPQVVYVPQYNPTVVYGSWPYPAYPPYPYYPPGYVASNLISFGVGVAIGAAWGYAWGNCNWGGGDVDINVNRNTNINNSIDRDKYKQNIQNRQSDRQGNRDTRQADRAGGGQGRFQHDPSHRKGVAYRDQATSSRFGGSDRSAQAVQARDSYRGRAEAGRQDIARGGASEFRGNNPQVNPNNRAGSGAGAGAGARAGGGTGVQNRAGNTAAGAGQNRPGGASPSAGNRASPSAGTANRGNAFSGAGSSGASARQSSQRGQTSRASSPARSAPTRSAPARSAPSRGGGGGGRRR